ncbi:MAG: hypothetical protein MJ175_13125, partial [Clostridia bacterium]|nr:hypothetical protein [Clostridia bacterium]
QTTTAETEAAIVRRDDLPELDFGGADVTMLVKNIEDAAAEYISGQETGEVIGDAVFARNRAIEERLNIKFHVQLASTDTVVNEAVKSITAGDNDFDVLSAPTYEAVFKTSKGYFRNLYDLPHFDAKKPYWSQGAIDSLSIGNSLYVVTGSPSISLYRFMYVTAYNNALFQKYDLDSLIPVVKAGKWTLDYQYNIAKGIYEDLNGDNTAGKEDLYGFVGGARTNSDTYWINMNTGLFVKDKDNYYTFAPDVERYSKGMEQLLRLYYEGTGSYAVPNADDGVRDSHIQTIFGEGRAVMATTHLYGIEYFLRDMKDEFTIIPMPKLDEAQENYRTHVQDQFTSLLVPVTVGDDRLETVGAFLECLGSESYDTVFNAYYETALSYKYLQNAESVDMLHLIFDSVYIEPSVVYFNEVGGLVTPLRTMVGKNQNNVASEIEKITSKVTTKLENMNEAFRELEANR